MNVQIRASKLQSFVIIVLAIPKIMAFSVYTFSNSSRACIIDNCYKNINTTRSPTVLVILIPLVQIVSHVSFHATITKLRRDKVVSKYNESKQSFEASNYLP